MTEQRSSASLSNAIVSDTLLWPEYPGVLTTLLASIVVVTLFLGFSSLTGQRFLAWVGMGLMVLIVGFHLYRWQQARKQRESAKEQLRANLISQCRTTEESPFLQRHHIGKEKVVLVLTENALQIGHRHPLKLFATVPLYNIESAAVTASEKENATPSHPVLDLALRTNGERLYHLLLSDFESHAPAAMWAQALTKRTT